MRKVRIGGMKKLTASLMHFGESGTEKDVGAGPTWSL
jgi:hypothetical protein